MQLCVGCLTPRERFEVMEGCLTRRCSRRAAKQNHAAFPRLAKNARLGAAERQSRYADTATERSGVKCRQGFSYDNAVDRSF
jgi:hypothetical protein